MFIAGTGIYYGRVGEAWSTTKTRGFESGQLSREMLSKLWNNDGRTGTVRMHRHRFIGMGTALHRIHGFYPPHARLWRQFINEVVDKTLDVEPRRRWLVPDAPYDGRSVAPTLASHRETARGDRERLARLEARYDEMVRRYERASASESPGRSALAAAMLEPLMLLSQQITSQRREGSSIFAWADDPAV